MHIFTSYLAALKPLKSFLVSVLFAFTTVVPFSEAHAHDSVPSTTVEPVTSANSSGDSGSGTTTITTFNRLSTASLIGVAPSGTTAADIEGGFNAAYILRLS